MKEETNPLLLLAPNTQGIPSSSVVSLWVLPFPTTSRMQGNWWPPPFIYWFIKGILSYWHGGILHSFYALESVVTSWSLQSSRHERLPHLINNHRILIIATCHLKIYHPCHLERGPLPSSFSLSWAGSVYNDEINLRDERINRPKIRRRKLDEGSRRFQ